jgi:hypothetical protein
LVAFGADHIAPAKTILRNAERYDAAAAVVAYKEFPGRPHFPGAPRWEEVADFALSWATANAMPNGPLTEPARSSPTSPKGTLHVLSDDR